MEPLLLILQRHLYSLAFALTWILTTLMVFLILKKTEKPMKEYSQILLHSAIVDFVATCGFTFCQTQLEYQGSHFFTRSGSLLPTLPGQLQCVYPMLYGLFYNISYLPIPLQCVCMYYNVYRKQRLPRSLVVGIYLGLLGLLIPSGYYYVVVFTPIENQTAPSEIIKSIPFWQNASGIERFCVSELSNPGIYVFCLFLNFISLFGLATIFYTSFKCYSFLKLHHSQMSRKSLQMQAQLGRRLILQAILPSIIAINTLILCLSPYVFPDYDGGLYIFLFLPYPWLGVINSLATIFSVKSYRLTFFTWIYCNPRRKQTANSHGHFNQIKINVITLK